MLFTSICVCEAECRCCDPTPAISTLNCCVRFLLHIQCFFFISQQPPICMCVSPCGRYGVCVWVSMFGTELLHCMPARQCDFSRGQGEVMFVLVSFGKLAVSVCQGVTLGNLVCEPASLIDNMCLCLCRRLLYFYLISVKVGK